MIAEEKYFFSSSAPQERGKEGEGNRQGEGEGEIERRR